MSDVLSEKNLGPYTVMESVVCWVQTFMGASLVDAMKQGAARFHEEYGERLSWPRLFQVINPQGMTFDVRVYMDLVFTPEINNPREEGEQA